MIFTICLLITTSCDKRREPIINKDSIITENTMQSENDGDDQVSEDNLTSIDFLDSLDAETVCMVIWNQNTGEGKVLEENGTYQLSEGDIIYLHASARLKGIGEKHGFLKCGKRLEDSTYYPFTESDTFLYPEEIIITMTTEFDEKYELTYTMVPKTFSDKKIEDKSSEIVNEKDYECFIKTDEGENILGYNKLDGFTFSEESSNEGKHCYHNINDSGEIYYRIEEWERLGLMLYETGTQDYYEKMQISEQKGEYETPYGIAKIYECAYDGFEDGSYEGKKMIAILKVKNTYVEIEYEVMLEDYEELKDNQMWNIYPYSVEEMEELLNKLFM